MGQNHQILDQSGNPIPSRKNTDDDILSPGIQALIETRINTAIDDLRERNRTDLKELSKDHSRNWRYLAVISAIITIVSVFYAPDKIITSIEKQVDKKLTEPMLIDSAERLIKTQMSEYVTEKLSPLNEDALKLKLSIEGISQRINEKQLSLEQKQNEIKNKLHIQELAIATKAGSKEAYIKLTKMDKDSKKSSDLLTATLKEIELFFDADRGSFTFPILVQLETMKDPGFAVDEVIYMLHKNNNLSEAAINTLGNLKSKATVKELIDVINKSENLRAITRAIRAIEMITGENIQPLDFDKLNAWWAENKNKQEYLGDYTGYRGVLDEMWNSPSIGALDKFIEELSNTIETDSGALHSKCLKAGFLIMKNEFEDAKKILEEVKNDQSDYYWYYIWNASLMIKEGDLENAIDEVNLAFEKSPTSNVVRTIKYWKVFNPIVQNNRISWPKSIN